MKGWKKKKNPEKIHFVQGNERLKEEEKTRKSKSWAMASHSDDSYMQLFGR